MQKGTVPIVRDTFARSDGLCSVQVLVIENAFFHWGVADNEIRATGIFLSDEAAENGDRLIYWRVCFGNLTPEMEETLPSAYRAFIEKHPEFEGALRSE